MFPDDQSKINIDFNAETANLQINNNNDFNGITQQIISVVVDGNGFRTTLQSLNIKQSDIFSLLFEWSKRK